MNELVPITINVPKNTKDVVELMLQDNEVIDILIQKALWYSKNKTQNNAKKTLLKGVSNVFKTLEYDLSNLA